MLSSTIKSGPEFTETFDGRPLRIAIVHSRWNKPVIDALVNGAKKKLNEAGVLDQNIVTQTVPGSFELPLACQRSAPYPYFSYSSLLIFFWPCRIIAGSLVQAGATATDLLGGLASSGRSSTPVSSLAGPNTQNRPFDAVIAIGVLIKGETMHFEYICESVSHAIMRVGLDTGVPVIFGVLTALSEQQALDRAGLGSKKHNHGEDWGTAAVEMASRTRKWSEGIF
ncbi:6,7-dimetjyl-8-ribityllumazine synthase [Lactifluus volemus]|nr:6,7-dimetjyl-8-ribityllumazine synthase [Lactifluus volemus]